MSTLGETYGQQAGILNQCLMGNGVFIAHVVEVEDTHILGRTGNWTRDWTDQGWEEEPGSNTHGLEGKDWTGA